MNTENIINRDTRDRIEALLGPRYLSDADGHATEVLLSIDGYRAMLEVVASAASTASLVLADVVNGFISPDDAEHVYGVVLDRQKRAVDEVATANLRKASNRNKPQPGARSG